MFELTNHKSKSKVQVQVHTDDWVFIKIRFSGVATFAWVLFARDLFIRDPFGTGPFHHLYTFIRGFLATNPLSPWWQDCPPATIFIEKKINYPFLAWNEKTKTMGRRIHNFRTIHVGFSWYSNNLFLYDQSPTWSPLSFSYCTFH